VACFFEKNYKNLYAVDNWLVKMSIVRLQRPATSAERLNLVPHPGYP